MKYEGDTVLTDMAADVAVINNTKEDALRFLDRTDVQEAAKEKYSSTPGELKLKVDEVIPALRECVEWVFDDSRH